MKICSVAECPRPSRARGWCTMHYTRWRKQGDPEKVLVDRGEPIRERLERLTNRENGCWLWLGHTGKGGYGLIQMSGANRANRPAHRVSYEEYKGTIPKGMFVDHIKCPTSCINPEHLRLVTNKQNQENRQGLPKDNTSGYLGVSYSKARGMWKVTVGHGGKTIHGGYYPLYELHVAGYRAMMKRNELFTHNDKDKD